LVGVLDIGITSFKNLTDYTQEELDVQRAERASDIQYISSTGGVAIVPYIIAIITAFVLTQKTKVIGSILLVISVATLFLIGYFGVIGFALLLTGGIVALRYKAQPPTPQV
jgi:uncharacterized membrane protein